MKQIKNIIFVFFTLFTSLGHAGFLDRFYDRGLEVHRLQVGETRIIRGLTVQCVGDLDHLMSYTTKEGVFYMNALNHPVRDRVPGTAIYCGGKSDRIAYEARNQLAEESEVACMVNVNKASGSITMTIYDKVAERPIQQIGFSAGQLELANAACLKNQDEGLCNCRALPTYLLQPPK